MLLKKICSLILIASIALISTSCQDDNDGFKEYFHPMGNNPVQVIPWLQRVKKSFYGKEARISLYKLDEKEYFTAQVIIETDSMTISPFTIYETNDEEGIVYFHTKDALASKQDDQYIYFIENAELVNILWSNESKHAPFDF